MKFKILTLTIFLVWSFNSKTFSINDDVWKELYNNKGFHVSFIFYDKANNRSNGVVLKLVNKNDYSISYEFKLIFRAGEMDKEKIVTGLLKRKQAKAGSNDGLFFIPFNENVSISEVGIKGIKINEVLPEEKNPKTKNKFK